MIFHIITIFPNIFQSYFQESIIRRAQEKNKIKIKIYNLRDFTEDKHKTIDDTPYGGGVGMIMKIEPIYKAITSIKKNIKNLTKTKTISFAAQGKEWNQNTANNFKNLDNIIMICGRYEGIDARIKEFIDIEISVGKYILTGGEIPAMILVDSISRLLPDVLGNKNSLQEESHVKENYLEYPQYTRPEIFKTNNKEYKVPPILLSGNHKEIENFKKSKKF